MKSGAELFRQARVENQMDREHERKFGQKYGVFPLTKAGKPYKTPSITMPTREAADAKAVAMEEMNPGKKFIVQEMF